jgi:Flp pilus assembly protein TadG
MKRLIKRWLRDSAGQSMIEFALTLPLIAFSLLGGADMARAFAVQLAVQNGARAAAEATSLDATPTSGEAITHAQQEMNRTPGMNALNAGITLTVHNGNFVNGSCTVSPPTIANPCYSTVRVTYTYTTLIAWPLLPSIFNFDRRTTVRRYS